MPSILKHFLFQEAKRAKFFIVVLIGDFVKLTAVPSFFHVCISDAAFLIC